jgi:hypothetical protein
MKRPGSSFIMFRELIPADLPGKTAGLALVIPMTGHAEAKAHLVGVWRGLGLATPADPLSTNDYGLIDLSSWLRRQVTPALIPSDDRPPPA